MRRAAGKKKTGLQDITTRGIAKKNGGALLQRTRITGADALGTYTHDTRTYIIIRVRVYMCVHTGACMKTHLHLCACVHVRYMREDLLARDTSIRVTYSRYA